MRLGRILCPLLGLAALAACSTKADDTRTESVSPGAVAPPATDRAAVRHMIDSSNAVLADAIVKEDVAAQGSVYADDGIVMMSNMPAWKGRDAIRKGAVDMFAAMDAKDVKFNTQDVDVSGDIAVETGTFSMTLTPKGGKAVEEKGKYITVWKRQADGTWKIARDISNSDREAK